MHGNGVELGTCQLLVVTKKGRQGSTSKQKVLERHESDYILYTNNVQRDLMCRLDEGHYC